MLEFRPQVAKLQQEVEHSKSKLEILEKVHRAAKRKAEEHQSAIAEAEQNLK